jgi:hypothetical protein
MRPVCSVYRAWRPYWGGYFGRPHVCLLEVQFRRRQNMPEM